MIPTTPSLCHTTQHTGQAATRVWVLPGVRRSEHFDSFRHYSDTSWQPTAQQQNALVMTANKSPASCSWTRNDKVNMKIKLSSVIQAIQTFGATI
jgi:hypothetical protein